MRVVPCNITFKETKVNWADLTFAKTSGIVYGNNNPTEAKRLNVKKTNTNDQRKWRHVQTPRKTGQQKRHHDDSREQKEHIPFKKQRLTTEELENIIKDKIQKSKESIAKLKKHIENNTCPKTLRYNAKANIAPDEEFKRDISWIRKDAERKVLGALVKFYDRRVERSKSRLVKLEQESRKEKKKDMSDKVPANTLEFSHEEKLENIQKKIDELNKMKYVLQKY